MIIYGHRGAKGEAPENTLAGFVHAYRHGIRCFEMDLQLSKDGEPVVIHDLTVDRTTRQSGKVSAYTTKQLAVMDARHDTAPWPNQTGIPRLADMLEACPDFHHLQLEVKADGRQRLNVLCNRLVELIQRHHWFERVTITSSDTWFLQEVKRRDRHISIGLVAEKRFPNAVTLASRLNCDYLCLSWKLCTAPLVSAARTRGMHVSVWTVNRIHDMLQLEEKGVDSIITDFPTSTQIYFDNRLKVAGAPLNRISTGQFDPEASGA
ncbi:glycerophosphodiester phosphodiesterase [Mangrovitalea sediminis]|uniref:glycerophosphodiester phosphodiesterase n=1 Tax=Mangrovitalea sediminis TaxID=1982043 RepID=UPI000BE61B2E|nr:glycerophosphodiester phosphodiesterase [Mangrovitalea sediminis]